MTDKINTPRRPSNPVLETLATSFPVFRDCQPLAIGIHKAIKARLPEISESQLRFALKSYTASTKYLKSLAKCETRFDLDGNPVGAITPEQRLQAETAIKERFRKAAERKQAEQQEMERQEKLKKLAEKFNQR